MRSTDKEHKDGQRLLVDQGAGVRHVLQILASPSTLGCFCCVLSH